MTPPVTFDFFFFFFFFFFGGGSGGDARARTAALTCHQWPGARERMGPRALTGGGRGEGNSSEEKAASAATRLLSHAHLR